MYGTNEKSVEEEFNELFHYTSEEGLYGILTSNTLWATHYSNLNDTKEFFLFRDFLVQYFRDRLIEEEGYDFPSALEKAVRVADDLYKGMRARVRTH